MLFHKTNKVCCLKVKLTEKHVGSTLRFHFQSVSHLSMSNSCNNDRTANEQVQNHKIEFIMSVRPLTVKLPFILANEKLLTILHFHLPPS